MTAAEMLAKAAGHDGKYVQAFPSFGPERRGAPVRAFCRIDDKQITIRSQVYEPDYLVVLEPSLLHIDVKDAPSQERRAGHDGSREPGMKKNRVFVINSDKPISSVDGCKAYSFDATNLALKTIGKDIVNTAILGAFAKATGVVTLQSLLKVIAEKFPGKLGELNSKMIKEAYEQTKI